MSSETQIPENALPAKMVTEEKRSGGPAASDPTTDLRPPPNLSSSIEATEEALTAYAYRTLRTNPTIGATDTSLDISFLNIPMLFRNKIHLHQKPRRLQSQMLWSENQKINLVPVRSLERLKVYLYLAMPLREVEDLFNSARVTGVLIDQQLTFWTQTSNSSRMKAVPLRPKSQWKQKPVSNSPATKSLNRSPERKGLSQTNMLPKRLPFLSPLDNPMLPSVNPKSMRYYALSPWTLYSHPCTC